MSDLAAEMRAIDKAFPGVVANRQVDFAARWGEVHALLGENGAGKTTLMSILAGLYRPDAGQISIDGQQLVFHAPRDAIEHGVGMVYQHYRLVPSQTVAENLLLGLPHVPFRLRAGTVISQARELGQRYHLQVDPSRPVWQLSVGEQQRVEILKTLQRGARILILDEPTAVLTPQESEDLLQTLRRIAGEGRTVILISHKLEEVRSVADRVTVLRGGAVVAADIPIASVSTRDLARLMVGDDARSLRSAATGASGGPRRLAASLEILRSPPGANASAPTERSGPTGGVAAGDGSDLSGANQGLPADGSSEVLRSRLGASDSTSTEGAGPTAGAAGGGGSDLSGANQGVAADGSSEVVRSRLGASDAVATEGAGPTAGAVAGDGSDLSGANQGVAADGFSEVLREARLVVEDVSALDARGLTALKSVRLEVARGEILGIAGVAGNGQHQLAQVLTGLRPVVHGRISLDGRDVTGLGPRAMVRRGVAHIPEDRLGEGLVGNLPVADNAILRSFDRPPIARGPFLIQQRVIQFTQSLLERFGIRARPESATRLLSGGQLQRLLLAREMALEPRLIVAVHPTRGLDVAATQQVQEWLLEARQNGTSIILISEDLDEVMQLSDRIAVLYEGQIVGTLGADQADRETIGLMMAGSHTISAGAA